MLYSKLFAKTIKTAKDLDSISATLLTKGGFIDQTMAGAYTYLPLGTKVLAKIENIVRTEMDKVGQEVFMSALSPFSLWETTGRLETVDVLFKAQAANSSSTLKNDGAYILNSTHEEVITPIAKKFNTSYKDLPFALYQIQTKFRNEARPKTGVLRTREFRMKDLYSFHASEEDLKNYYEIVKQSYLNVYKAVGLEKHTFIALASGGDFTKDFSHEFQVRCDAGEDTLFRVPSTGITYNKEVAPAKSPIPLVSEELKPLEKVHTPNAVTVTHVVRLLNTTPQKLVKTMIYTRQDGTHFAIAIRGDYELNDIKIEKVLNIQGIKLATEEAVMQLTGSKVGYAGIKGLEGKLEIFYDDSLADSTNMIMGACESEQHLTNINFGRDITKPSKFYDFKMAQEGDIFPETGEVYEVFKASEVGNIFPLNTKFSKAFGYTYTNANGEENLVYMGSYGIGTTRLLGVIAEVFNDNKGLLWPVSIAPFKIHLVGLNLEDKDTKAKTYAVYKNLQDKGVDVLLDDRENTTAGEKFADADLIGCPIRAVVSKKTEEGLVEMKLRKSTESTVVQIQELINIANSLTD
mgnify:CR=1 FL=1|jgi:prolyl-tRNA synthetase